MRTTKILFPVFFPLIAVLAVFRIVFPDLAYVGIFHYALSATLAVTILMAHKATRLQRLLGYSLGFMAVGDVFLILKPALQLEPINLSFKIDVFPLGMLAFLGAYTMLFIVISKGMKIGKSFIWIAIPILILLVMEITLVSPYVQGVLLYGLIVFGLVLSVLALLSINTLVCGNYPRHIAWMLAISTSLFLLSDLAVGFNQFHPIFTAPDSVFAKWLDAFVVLTYLPGWALIGKIAVQKDPIG